MFMFSKFVDLAQFLDQNWFEQGAPVAFVPQSSNF